MDTQIENMLKALDRETYGFPYDKIIYDQDGIPLKVGILDGKIVPPLGEKSYRKIKDLSIRDDDAIIIGYPKTSCHWTWEILNMIIAGRGVHSDAGKISCFLEAASAKMLDNCPPRRILNTHLWFDYLPEQVTEKKTKIIFTVRNPKDTAVSYYNHHLSLSFVQGYNGQFKNWFPLYMDGQVDYGSYFDFHQHWDNAIKNNPDHPTMIVSYEDMKEDLPREIRKMSRFIDVSLSDQQVEDIVRAAGFDAMKEVYSKQNIVSHSLIRKGQVEDWKNWLTVAQSETIDAAVTEKLKGTLFSSPRYMI